MSKWSFFYLLVPVAGVGLFAVADQYGWGLPENVSTAGKEIDFLYNFILLITGLTFIGTQAALFGIVYHFGKKRPWSPKALYTHGSQKLEIIWTIIPAIILFVIAVVQMPAWIKMKFPSHKPNIEPMARVIARQFEWRIIYPGADHKLGTFDDVHVPNELHIVKDRKVLIDLRSMDVLHSFFLPHLRVKNDAVPGLAIPVWFDALKSTRQFQDEHANFDAVDLIDAGGLAIKLKEKKSALATYLAGELDPETASLLQAYSAEFEPNEKLKGKLLDDLNRLLIKEDLYSVERFPTEILGAETKDHLEQPPAGIYRRLLNRQLLQDGLVEEIAPIRWHYDLVCAELCGWGHYKMKGRLIVHDTQEELDKWLATQTANQEATR